VLPEDLGLVGQNGAMSWEELLEAVRHRNQTLTNLKQAVRSPARHANQGADWRSYRVPIHEIRCCAEWLYLAVLAELKQQHPHSAAANAQALVDLAYLYEEEYRMECQYTRVAVLCRVLSAM
jgi:hypothetical protein